MTRQAVAGLAAFLAFGAFCAAAGAPVQSTVAAPPAAPAPAGPGTPELLPPPQAPPATEPSPECAEALSAAGEVLEGTPPQEATLETFDALDATYQQAAAVCTPQQLEQYGTEVVNPWYQNTPQEVRDALQTRNAPPQQ